MARTRLIIGAALIAGFLALLGISVLTDLQRETFPDFAAQELEIQVVYPGASAEDVEEAICQRIEDVVDGVNDLEEIRCLAREGMASAVVEMSEGGDLPRFLDDIKTEVEAIDNFPEEIEVPVIRERDDEPDLLRLPVPAGDGSGSGFLPAARRLRQRTGTHCRTRGPTGQDPAAGGPGRCCHPHV